MADHAILSASGAHRWLACTPSARFEMKFPKRKGLLGAKPAATSSKSSLMTTSMRRAISAAKMSAGNARRNDTAQELSATPQDP